MSVVNNQSMYPEEADARAAIQEELKWVKKNVYDVPDGEAASTASLNGLVKPVDTCQKFCVTAPGPGQSTGPDNRQRACSQIHRML